jgi:hypothetical protein
MIILQNRPSVHCLTVNRFCIIRVYKSLRVHLPQPGSTDQSSNKSVVGSHLLSVQIGLTTISTSGNSTKASRAARASLDDRKQRIGDFPDDGYTAELGESLRQLSDALSRASSTWQVDNEAHKNLFLNQLQTDMDSLAK